MDTAGSRRALPPQVRQSDAGKAETTKAETAKAERRRSNLTSPDHQASAVAEAFAVRRTPLTARSTDSAPAPFTSTTSNRASART